MKATLLQKAGPLFLWIFLAYGDSVQAQIPITQFRAGAYRGTVHFTVSIDGVAETTATLKVKGRSTGNSTLRFMGVPQLAEPLLAADDDFPVKLFSIEYDIVAEGMVFTEVKNVDTQGAKISRGLESLTLNGNLVRAETQFSRTLGPNTMNFTIQVTLKPIAFGI
jgi:hypothetical protein